MVPKDPPGIYICHTVEAVNLALTPCKHNVEVQRHSQRDDVHGSCCDGGGGMSFREHLANLLNCATPLWQQKGKQEIANGLVADSCQVLGKVVDKKDPLFCTTCFCVFWVKQDSGLTFALITQREISLVGSNQVPSRPHGCVNTWGKA